jgi:putative endonuclease
MTSEESRGAYVYVLTDTRSSVLYVGATNNLKKRVYHHKQRLVPGFTKKYNVDRLVYYESHQNMDAARTREKQLKGKTRAKKNVLVESTNPSWNDLSSELS